MAVRDGAVGSSRDAGAGETGLGLLVGCEGDVVAVLDQDGGLAVDGGGLGAIIEGEGAVAGCGASDFAGVVTPVEADVGAALAELILDVGGLIEALVVVDAEGSVDVRISARLDGRAEAARLWGEEAGGYGGEDDLSGEVVDLGDVETAVEAGDLGIVPADGEGDGRRAKDRKVIGVVGVLPDVVGGEDSVAGECLLEAGVEVVAEAGAVGRGGAGDEGGDDCGVAALGGEDEVLVEGRLERACIGDAEDGACALDVVGEG